MSAQHEEAGRKGGKAAIGGQMAKARTKHSANAAERRAATRSAAEEAAKPPAPLPPFLAGDLSGLPKAPPGRRAP